MDLKIVIGLLLVLSLVTIPVTASVAQIPELPMTIRSSNISIEGSLAAAGTEVSATGEGVYINEDYGNPVTLTRAGQFGIGSWDTKLSIQGQSRTNLPTGTMITFEINGEPCKVRQHGTTPWLDTIAYRSGSSMNVDLKLDTQPEDTPSPDETPEPDPYTDTPRMPEFIYSNGSIIGFRVWDSSTGWIEYYFSDCR